VDSLLVKAGSGALTFGNPDSAGIPESFAKETIVLPYNDLSAVELAFSQTEGGIAAIIVEPYPANCGFILPDEGYLEGLRALCSKHQTVLIFDEVMTGFRIGLGGVQERTAVTPDLTAMGKIIGGGLPVGAFGGKAEIMDHLAPLGPVYQAGTLSGNPLAMAAGIASLKLLRESMPYEKLEQLGSQLAQGVAEIAREHSIPLQVPQVGSMYCLFFSESPVRNYEDALSSDGETFKKLFQSCLKNGVYLPPSAYETCFISAAHSPDNISMTLDCFQSAFRSF
jgi:glutamate-1-semialdehyde 2,1-aminomutase